MISSSRFQCWDTLSFGRYAPVCGNEELVFIQTFAARLNRLRKKSSCVKTCIRARVYSCRKSFRMCWALAPAKCNWSQKRLFPQPLLALGSCELEIIYAGIDKYVEQVPPPISILANNDAGPGTRG